MRTHALEVKKHYEQDGEAPDAVELRDGCAAGGVGPVGCRFRRGKGRRLLWSPGARPPLQTPGMARFSGRSTRTSRNPVASDIEASTKKNVEWFHSFQ